MTPSRETVGFNSTKLSGLRRALPSIAIKPKKRSLVDRLTTMRRNGAFGRTGRTA